MSMHQMGLVKYSQTDRIDSLQWKNMYDKYLFKNVQDHVRKTQ